MNQRGRYSGGRNHQKLPISNRGAGGGGAQAPPALEDESQGVCDQDSKKLFHLQSTIDHEGPGRTPLCVFDFLRKN